MEYRKGYVFELMNAGGPTDVREPYFMEAVIEMMRARTLCAKANAKMPDDEEIWLTTREENGKSSLTTLGGSGIRYDKDIRKMYLEGRLRGVPRMHGGFFFHKEG